MPETLRNQAIRLLARREHSRAELQRKLQADAESPEQLAATLDALQQSGLLSDHRYAQQRSSQRGQRYGDRRLRQELVRQGIDDETIAVSLADCGDEKERCRQVWLKKFGTLADTPQERARQLRFLQYRGFSGTAIRAVLHGDEDEA
jgi:regulatory protein